METKIEPLVNKLYLSWKDIEIHTLNLSHHILNYFSEVNLPDMLISIGRGGMIPTRLVSECTTIKNIKVFDIKCYTDENKVGNIEIGHFDYDELEDKSIVLIDDVYTTGTTLNAVINSIENNSKNCSISTATLYWNTDNLQSKDGKTKRPDVYSGVYSAKDTWIVFPWEEIWNTFSNYRNTEFARI